MTYEDVTPGKHTFLRVGVRYSRCSPPKSVRVF